MNSKQFNHAFAVVTAALIVSFAATNSLASIVDLTFDGGIGTINGAIYQQVDALPTGTGNIDSFVQQNAGGSAVTSRAYNTTVNNTFDNGSSANFNHSITLGQIPKVNLAGIDYRQFLLDINENNNSDLDQYLSLDEVQLFIGGPANSNVTTFTSGILDYPGGATLVYRMDAGMDNWVALNYDLNTGGGSGDMYLYVLDSLFTGRLGSEVVTLYSEFGLQGPLGVTIKKGASETVYPNPFSVPNGIYGSSDGFEEWAVVGLGGGDGPDPPPPLGGTIPEPTSVAVWSLIVGLGVAFTSRSKR